MLERRTLLQLQECVQRGRPLGDAAWLQTTAERLGLTVNLRGPGRAKKDNQ